MDGLTDNRKRKTYSTFSPSSYEKACNPSPLDSPPLSKVYNQPSIGNRGFWQTFTGCFGRSPSRKIEATGKNNGETMQYPNKKIAAKKQQKEVIGRTGMGEGHCSTENLLSKQPCFLNPTPIEHISKIGESFFSMSTHRDLDESREEGDIHSYATTWKNGTKNAEIIGRARGSRECQAKVKQKSGREIEDAEDLPILEIEEEIKEGEETLEQKEKERMEILKREKEKETEEIIENERKETEKKEWEEKQEFMKKKRIQGGIKKINEARNNRNILFLGNSNGKSTVIEILKGDFGFTGMDNNSRFYKKEQEEEEEEERKEVRVSRISVEVRREKEEGEEEEEEFHIKALDTPPLFRYSQCTGKKQEKIWEDVVWRCGREGIKKIHSIFFVVRFGVVDIQDIKALELLLKYFEGAEKHIHLLVSKCEKLGDADKRKIVEELNNHPQMKGLLHRIGKRIFFTGSVHTIDYEKGFVDAFKYNLNNVVHMRESLFSFIFQQEDTFEWSTLPALNLHIENLLLDIEDRLSKYKFGDHCESKSLEEKCTKLVGLIPLLDDATAGSANLLLNKAAFLLKLNKNP